MADKIKKNLLGRTVSKSSYQYNDPTTGNLVKKNSRVVFDKNEDVAKSKVRTTTYKPTSSDGKMTSYKKEGSSVVRKKGSDRLSRRVANANKPQMSSKLDGTYQNSPMEGRKVGFSKETTYKEKNALGKPVSRERKVTPTANVPTVSEGFTVRKTRTTTGKGGVGSKVRFTEKKYDNSGKLVGRSRVKYKTDASGVIKKGGKSVYREKGGSVLKKKNHGEDIIKATGRFAPKTKK